MKKYAQDKFGYRENYINVESHRKKPSQSYITSKIDDRLGTTNIVSQKHHQKLFSIGPGQYRNS